MSNFHLNETADAYSGKWRSYSLKAIFFHCALRRKHIASNTFMYNWDRLVGSIDAIESLCYSRFMWNRPILYDIYQVYN